MSVSVGTNEQRIKAFYLSNKKKQALKYLNTKRIKTHRRPYCADLCMRMDLPLDKKLWKIRTGPPGRGPAFCKTNFKSGFPQIWTKLWHKSKNRFCLYFAHR